MRLFTTHTWRVIYRLGFSLPGPLSVLCYFLQLHKSKLADWYISFYILSVFCGHIFTVATRETTLIIRCMLSLNTESLLFHLLKICSMSPDFRL